MTQLADVRYHRIFRVEKRGRALVVTPMGDSPGFGNADFKVERERVMSLLANDRQPVIIDFGEANYFGSEMIGVVSRMLGTVRERGGEYAVVNVSGDMREGLAIMKLDEHWNLMDERTALRDVAKESVLSSVHRLRKPLMLALASLLLVGGAVYAYLSIDRSRDVGDYEMLRGTWEDFRTTASRPGYELELQSWKRDQVERLEPMIERWEHQNTDLEPLRTVFLIATREHLVKMLDPYTRNRDPEAERAFLVEMEKARKLIEDEKGIELSRLSNPYGDMDDSSTTSGSADSHAPPAVDGGHAAPSPWSTVPPTDTPAETDTLGHDAAPNTPPSESPTPDGGTRDDGATGTTPAPDTDATSESDVPRTG